MKTTPLPDGLPWWSVELLNKFCQSAISVTYKKGSTILHPMMDNHSIFLVQTGVVDYKYFSVEGNVATIQQIRSGELFGIKSVFTEEKGEREEKHFFVVANTNVKLWKMANDMFSRLMEQDPAFSKCIVQYFVYYVNKIERRLMRSAVLSNYQRIILLLMDYAEDIQNNTAVVQMTQQSLGNMLAISRQSVSTHLSALTRKQLVSIHRGKIYILDWEALTQELVQTP